MNRGRNDWPRGVNRDLEPLADLIAERGISIGHPLEIMEEIDSTNDAAKRAAKLGAPSGALFVAESQTKGRGRQGRTWVGTRGESILASLLVRLECEPRKLPPITLACGLAVRDAMHIERAKLKWPNDVLIDGRKVAGVLVEATVTSSVDAVIIGFGINVHQRTFPDDIAERATSIAIANGGANAVDRAVVLADVLAGIDRDVAHVAARGLGLLHARLVAADALSGRRIATDDGVTGEALAIELDGTLRIRTDAGTIVRLAAGEVHLV
jgi:BirA family transcriptional regulator, biotin operon repressor / biotin---[acetyl-CoA-carboxylase] ligase